MLQLNILGTLSLQGEIVPVPSAAQQKRRLALLALLATGEERGISRDRLQTYLWPESSGPRARHALDQLIYATRRSLGTDPILSEGRELRLNPCVMETDIRLFSDAIKDARFADAAAMYGGRLLDGFHIGDSRELENWIDTERARLEAEYHRALESLAREAEDRCDHRTGIDLWLRLSASDPHSSRIAAETVRAFISAGDHAGAILHARSYQHLLRTDLEVEPDPAIENLVSRLPRPRALDPRQKSPDFSHSPLEAHESDRSGPTSEYHVVGDGARGRGLGHSGKMATAAILILLAFVVSFGLLRYLGESSPPSAAASSNPRTLNPDARAFYLRGLNAWNDRSRSALDTAVVYFRKAAESEPEYAEAHAGMANAYVMIGYSGYRPANAMFPKAKAAALRAIAIDSTIAAPYAALGMELTWERRFTEAEIAYRKSIELDPTYATAHQWYGILLMILSRTQEAVAETRRAAELDPLSLQIQNNYATFLSSSGQPQAALLHYQKVVGEEPDSAWVRRNPWLLTNMAAVYSANRQFDKALRYAERAVAILPGHPRALSALAGVYYRMGKPDLARETFARADTLNEHYAAYRAFNYSASGQPDSAFAWFDRVNEWGIPILISVTGLRASRTVGDDPRLRALFTRIGLPFVPLRPAASRLPPGRSGQ